MRAFADLATVRAEIGGEYPFGAISRSRWCVRALSPHIGPSVVGAVFCPMDGHINPLRLLRALVQGFRIVGGELCAGVHIENVARRQGQFHARRRHRSRRG
ncbi:MAG: hypothetical protein IPP88_21910 [Betaproteobacteria bacterium]|nr:hypothetical protein [Betaproteobacteria bacterium]